MSHVIENMATQRAEDTPILWLLREGAIVAPHYSSLQDLAEHDERVEAQMDGLRTGAVENLN